MPSNRQTKISKYLSYHLRHAPQELGLTLQPGGWVNITDLLTAASQDKYTITRQELETIVAESEKQRFAIDPTGEKIRANQGHSVTVDLKLEPMGPPAILYHGTAAQFVDQILESGLKKMARHHVHLSADTRKAKDVGQRRGKPVIFQVDAAAMDAAGIIFYCSENGVWLTDHVPPEYLTPIV
ncbi:RNA 2'-phosphotransferase [filamentous cyanobacterium LEGE 11480]|uniref:Probable RNA 2'-phosphotransferase n=1 Tax=Romeriopsis navalis LEGE 11480 TaxID=2777977 RepID=A0A928VJ50_9CYAN|nr:RNA 2'-phosphotransferase [Romeriopsis navalis]MBE9029578.1 RNA 2'-phosphotransferase [Romeriopsis navalis LEGE 11480]